MVLPYSVEVVVHTSAERVKQHVWQWGDVEAESPARCRLWMNVDTLAWPAMVLGAVGAEFEVVDPPELAAYVREWGERFARSTT